MIITFKHRKPEGHGIFEDLFEPALRLDMEYKDSLLENAAAAWMFVDGELAWETYGVALSDFEEGDELEGMSELEMELSMEPSFDPIRVIYCYSTALLPQFRGRGLGKILKAHFLGMCAQRGCQTVLGHAKDGVAMGINGLFGAKIVQTFPVWYECPIPHHLYRLDF